MFLKTNHFLYCNLFKHYTHLSYVKKMQNSKKSVLLAIPSFLDPEMFQQKGEEGPILQMLHENDFDEVVLFGLQAWRLNAFLTEQAINAKFPKVKVVKHILNINNIFSYKEVFYELKRILMDFEKTLSDECDEPVVLLPPSACGCLLDCWLLLSTSLSINVRICQIEPHYSSEGIYLQNSEEQNLDWLSDNEMKFYDFTCDKPCNQAQISLAESQISALKNWCQNEKAFCLQGLTEEVCLSIQKYLSNYARQHNKNCLCINCSEIPEEILQSVLCGYKKSIENNKTFERKGLFSKIKSGWIVLSDFQKLSASVQQNLRQIVQTKQDLHVVGMLTNKTQSIIFPSFEFSV